MKLPTLNIDVALNTQTLRKDVAKANAEILKVGRGALAAGGPMGGRAGQLAGAAGALFGTGAGAGVVMAGGAALAAAAPVKTAMAIVDAFAESAERGRKALDSFAEGKGTGGLDLVNAAKLAESADYRAVQATSTKGLSDVFFGSMMDESGRTTGLAGLIDDWAVATAEGFRTVVAGAGAALAGADAQEFQRRLDVATTRSAAGAQAYMSMEQINYMATEAEKNRKQKREQET
ncbi:MAG: hypothetical protein RL721_2372 [Candidatus Eisenbacteria bacterium]